MGLRPHMKTGLNVRNWVELMTTFCSLFSQFLTVLHLRGPLVTPWFHVGLDISLKKGENVAQSGIFFFSARYSHYLLVSCGVGTVLNSLFTVISVNKGEKDAVKQASPS